ncbi:MAG: DUF1549 domain-containing protein, partial [Verrucomicrobiota bacterium]
MVWPCQVAVGSELVILPAAFSLEGPEARQRVVVVERDGDRFAGEAREVDWHSSDEGVVEIVDGVATARGNGTVTLTATTELGAVECVVSVTDFEEPFGWSFNRHVQPVLTKQGCNMGACHGAVAGKGGFRLSLRAYDPPRDFYTITREAQGRRIEPAAPTRSLLLTKPTMATPHKGGKLLDPLSREYRVLAEWIAAGGAAPDPDEAPIQRIEVMPDISVLEIGDKQQILVTAFYEDGTTQDVTSWAKFESADETVATIDKGGRVSVIGHGEGAVSALFSSKVSLARLRVPFPNETSEQWFTEAPKSNFIDELSIAQLRELNLRPAERCDDETFIRRAYLDTIGVIPSPDEVRAFLNDTSGDKRRRLIGKLLERDEFVDYWAYRWSDVFLVNGKLLRPDAVEAYYQWIRGQIEKNAPWDAMARELVTATGNSYENGATNFYAVHQDPETMAENVSQAFLSLSINCAKCHDHPLEKWTNDQYYAFANLFARVRAKGWGGDTRNGDGERTIYVEPRGDLIQPRTGKPQPPAPLDGETINPEETGDRRVHLAEWLTSPDNDYFSRSITNRVWAAYFGAGLVDPVDDLRVSNPASNEPLLAALSQYLVDNKFDLRQLMRLILESETYQ